MVAEDSAITIALHITVTVRRMFSDVPRSGNRILAGPFGFWPSLATAGNSSRVSVGNAEKLLYQDFCCRTYYSMRKHRMADVGSVLRYLTKSQQISAYMTSDIWRIPTIVEGPGQFGEGERA
ncbi:hypothetical protein Shel_17430 [Slackia heliotrinireducens DSM 20476]|uniref:Uncharacterized protein n=1 Tax=Slackia heliotrinireducens (strain ATCC 29202 / DSM 20476 / NCTC 11029 / RHS 1) TaxID=471855 RepID=C7N777_SLAHD|nr:hypothetical protein Shel_17430 [Slackia heliotrinireducens DSM 20476]